MKFGLAFPLVLCALLLLFDVNNGLTNIYCSNPICKDRKIVCSQYDICNLICKYNGDCINLLLELEIGSSFSISCMQNTTCNEKSPRKYDILLLLCFRLVNSVYFERNATLIP